MCVCVCVCVCVPYVTEGKLAKKVHGLSAFFTAMNCHACEGERFYLANFEKIYRQISILESNVSSPKGTGK